MSRHRRPRRPISLFEVVVLTSPLLLALGVAGTEAVADFVRARQFDDWFSHSVTFRGALAGHILAALRTPRAMTVRQSLDVMTDDPVAIRVGVEPDAWRRGVANPFLERGRWVDATLVREGSNRDVRVRRRGDTSVHWTTPKTSFTLRAPKGERVRGFRELALSGKAVLESQIANSVPAEFGVTAPLTALTPVYLNERYYGLFRAIEPIDESFLRRHGWMPGDVFRADAAERGEYYKGIPRNVFTNPYIWERVAVGSGSDEMARTALGDWLDDLVDSDPDTHERAMGRVDREALARMLASMLVVGDPYHMSGVHNQFWFEDPSSGLLTPIPWDLRLLDLNARATNPLNDFFRLGLRDPFLADEVLRIVHVTAEGGLSDRLQARLEEDVERFAPHLEFERLRRELVSSPGDPDVIRRRLAGNLATLADWAEDARVGFAARYVDDLWILDIETRGMAGVDLVGVQVDGAAAASVQLIEDRDLDGRLSRDDRVLEASSESARVLHLASPAALPAAWRHDGRRFRAGRVHYRFFLTHSGSADASARVTPVLRNRMTGAALTPEEIEPVRTGESLGDGGGFHPWEFHEPHGRTTRWSGLVTLTETVRFSRVDTLVIDAGTTIRLAPDVSVISRGPILALGNGGARIRLVPQDSLPWGTLALQGPGASGSHLRFVTLVGGGGARDGRIEYSGMMTIHRARDVRLDDVVLQDNRRSDDALNAAHSEVYISRCVVRRANADAIDFDYTEGTIEGCTIEDSRNDAIDLMTSSPAIRSNRLLRSGDKGISIGEASHPVIVNNQIADGNRGIEIKDRSDPTILHNTIENNRIGLVSTAKNWRYAGGGRGTVALTRVSRNDTDLSLDGSSTLAVLRSQIGTAPISEIPEEPLPEWIRTAQGLVNRSARPGALGPDARFMAPVAPIWADDFGRGQARFYDDASDWTRAGRLRLRRGDERLTAWIERGDAVWGRQVDWDLPSGGELVIEVTGRDLSTVRVVVTTGDTEVSREVPIPEEAWRIGLVTVSIPSGRYSGLRFEVTANEDTVGPNAVTGLLERRGGRIDIHRIRLFDLGDGS